MEKDSLTHEQEVALLLQAFQDNDLINQLVKVSPAELLECRFTNSRISECRHHLEVDPETGHIVHPDSSTCRSHLLGIITRYLVGKGYS